MDDRLGVGADPVVVDGELRLGAVVGGDEGHVPRPLLRGEPVPDGIFHERLDREVGDPDGQDLGGDLQRDAQALAKPRLLEDEPVLGHQCRHRGTDLGLG